MYVFDVVKNAAVTMASSLMAYFLPINSLIFAVFLIFAVNFVAGMITGLIKLNERFSLKKFKWCLIESFIFYGLILFVFTVGERMRNPEDAIRCITAIVYIVLYFYGVNILRNLHILLPESRPIAFLYYVLSFEIIKKIPFMQAFLSYEQKEKKL